MGSYGLKGNDRIGIGNWDFSLLLIASEYSVYSLLLTSLLLIASDSVGVFP